MTREEIIKNLQTIEEDGWNVNAEAIEAVKLAIKALEQEPKSEWEHDHEILKAYSDGMNEVLDKIRAEIVGKKQKINFKGLDPYEKAQAEMRLLTLNEFLQIIDKYKSEGGE